MKILPGARQRTVSYVKSFPFPVWLLTAATLVESTGRFMVVPYLSLYLRGQGVSLRALGIVLGVSPLASVLFGALGGQLSDKWGRKPVQILGVALSGAALFGFAFAGSNIILVAFFNFLNGLTRTFYRPATQAAISDFTPPLLRSEAFALNRIALNAAFGWGPLLGVAVFATSPVSGFIAAGTINLLVGLFLALAVPESAPSRKGVKPADGNRNPNDIPENRKGIKNKSSSWKEVFSDGVFWIWVAGTACTWGAYDMIQSFLPLHLRDSGVPLWVYGALLATNALVCVLGQLPASRLFRISPIGIVSGLSKVPYVIGFLAFAFFISPPILILGMVVLTLGEIAGAAVQVRFVPERAKPELVGRYMGIYVSSELGRAIVAPVMGFVMAAWGGSAVFSGAALLSVAGGALMFVSGTMQDRSRIRGIKR